MLGLADSSKDSKEPNRSTKARPNPRTAGLSKTSVEDCVEHRGKGKEPGRSTEAMPNPRTVEEGTKQDQRRGPGPRRSTANHWR